MDTAVFLRGLAIGFGIAAPVGPIGILCIRRTLANGLYGAVAAFGLTPMTGGARRAAPMATGRERALPVLPGCPDVDGRARARSGGARPGARAADRLGLDLRLTLTNPTTSWDPRSGGSCSALASASSAPR
jgi:hypothetical protein